MPIKPYVAFYQSSRKFREGFQALRPLKALVVSDLRAASKEFGQNTIAHHIGITPAYLNDIIQEKREVNAKFLERVNDASILEVER
jgi:hypothetical protein